MSTAIGRSLPLALFAALLFGCSSEPRFNFDGEWIGNRNLQIPNQPKDILYTAGRVTVSIKNTKFDLTEAGIPSSGSVSFEAGRARFHVESRFGVPLDRSGDAKLFDRTITLTPQPDGSLRYDDPLAPDGKPLKLVRILNK